jgi:hypothetical protein
LDTLTTTDAAAHYREGSSFALKNSEYSATIHKNSIQGLMNVLGKKYKISAYVAQNSEGDSVPVLATPVGSAIRNLKNVDTDNIFTYQLPEKPNITDICADGFVGMDIENNTMQYEGLHKTTLLQPIFKNADEALAFWLDLNEAEYETLCKSVTSTQELKRKLQTNTPIRANAEYSFGNIQPLALADAMATHFGHNLPILDTSVMLAYLQQAKF